MKRRGTAAAATPGPVSAHINRGRIATRTRRRYSVKTTSPDKVARYGLPFTAAALNPLFVWPNKAAACIS
ncbi:hypothetical protein J6590_034671 [Homalodisca vitripennis]|nr:hypothetical protein J6590_034671 [Homalodisca vitripennis]